MKRSSAALLCATLTLLLVGSAVRADPIPWDVTWTPSTGSIAPDKGTASKITLVGNSDSGAGNLNQPVNTAAAFVSYFSTSEALDSFTKKTFDLKVKVTDTTSGQSDTLTFKLQFDGGLSKSKSTLKLSPVPSTPLFTNPLGGHIYRVRITSYTPPPFYPQNRFVPGVIMATVTVADLPKPAGAPEPSTLLLAGLAAPVLGATLWRRRKR
jgi:hypothetical protein